jgi:hypothetical protein
LGSSVSLVARQAQVPHPRLGHQIEHALGHAQARAQHRHHRDRVRSIRCARVRSSGVSISTPTVSNDRVTSYTISPAICAISARKGRNPVSASRRYQLVADERVVEDDEIREPVLRHARSLTPAIARSVGFVAVASSLVASSLYSPPMNPPPPRRRLEQARKSLAEGGIPIGSVLATPDGTIVARGHNRRVQDGDTTAHAETVCIRAAGAAATGTRSRSPAR